MTFRCFLSLSLSLITFGQPLAAQDGIAREILDAQLDQIAKTKPVDPVILRLDLELEELVNRARDLPEDDRVAFLAQGLSPQRQLYATFGMPDLTEFSKYLLGKARYPKVNLHRDSFPGRDLSREIHQAYQSCAKAYGKPLPRAPLYKVAFGYQASTNAKLAGIDRNLKRHIILLNRSALAGGRLWDAAIIHETWHCFQTFPVGKKSLLQQAMLEGVVTHLTQKTDPTLKDHTVMLWSEKEWKAAVQHQDQIIAVFDTHRRSKDPAIASAFMTLGKRLGPVPKAPSRTGYFVGLLAARAWMEAHPDKKAADLIAASPNDLWRALVDTIDQ